MTLEQFKTIKKGDTLISPMGYHITVGEVKRNAKGETVRATMLYSAFVLTAKNCEKWEVKSPPPFRNHQRSA